MANLFHTIHDHLPILFVFIFQVLHQTTHNLSPTHFVGNLHCSVYKLWVIT